MQFKQWQFLTYRTCWPFCNPTHTHTHTCTVYNTYSTCTPSRSNEVGWRLFCDSVGQKLDENQFLTVAPPLTPTEGPPFEDMQNWQLSENVTQPSPNIPPRHTRSENEILWSLYVTEHYAKCDTLSHICRRVLFPQHCQSADLKIKGLLHLHVAHISHLEKCNNTHRS